MKFRELRSAALAVFAVLALAASAVVSVSAAAPAQAWSTTDFKASNIIDDVLFYDGTAMTASQVQSLLNGKVSRCTIGDPGRAAGSKWGSTKIASKCLRNFTSKTTSKAANANCSAYTGKSSETAAQIITRVASVCGISPKALVVMLEKEQSLVSDTWPTVMQFDRAMGYACPDSGPGNSANCDSKYYGFFNQVYSAAWQLKNYRIYPITFRQGQTSAVQWNPNKGCGTSNVKMENYATAALYTYTPYRPNTAALRAGWGTGDSCSSYGNRNFFNLWNSWFGSVRGNLQLTASMQAAYDAAAARGLDLGNPVSPRKTISANGGGYQMEFENGLITQSTKLGKSYALHSGGWMAGYLAAGGAAGSWGFLAGVESDTVDGFKTLTFQNGTAAHTASTGVQYMPAVVYSAWQQRGAQTGALKYPIEAADQRTSSSASQLFQGGTLMVSGTASTVVSSGDLQKWKDLGGYAALGFYTGDATAVGANSFRPSEKGFAFFTPAVGQLFIAGGEFTRVFFEAGGPQGAWGWPTAGKAALANGGSSIRFEGGVAVHSKATGVNFLTQGAYDDWIARGGATGPLGFPAADTVTVPEQGSYQQYQISTVFAGPEGNTQVVLNGEFTRLLFKAGGPAGAWGWPVEAKKPLAKGGSSLKFQNGVAVHSKGTGVTFLTHAAYEDWILRGGPAGSLKFPVKDSVIVGDGGYQQYALHHNFISPEGRRISLLTGAFTAAYFEAGGPAGSWGWPASGKKLAADGTSTVNFENGVAKHTPKKGVTFTPNPSAATAEPEGEEPQGS